MLLKLSVVLHWDTFKKIKKTQRQLETTKTFGNEALIPKFPKLFINKNQYFFSHEYDAQKIQKAIDSKMLPGVLRIFRTEPFSLVLFHYIYLQVFLCTASWIALLSRFWQMNGNVMLYTQGRPLECQRIKFTMNYLHKSLQQMTAGFSYLA